MAGRGCKSGDQNAVAFSKEEGVQKYAIKISAAAAVEMIRKMAGWSAEDAWNVPGVYLADGEVIVYDMTAAVKPRPHTGGRTAKKQNEKESPRLVPCTASEYKCE